MWCGPPASSCTGAADDDGHTGHKVNQTLHSAVHSGLNTADVVIVNSIAASFKSTMKAMRLLEDSILLRRIVPRVFSFFFVGVLVILIFGRQQQPRQGQLAHRGSSS